MQEKTNATSYKLAGAGDYSMSLGQKITKIRKEKKLSQVDVASFVGVSRDAISKYEQELLEYATEKLLGIEGLKIYGTSKNKTSVISFNLEGIHPYDVGTILDKMGIAVRTGHHCAQPIMDYFKIPGTIRASFAFYNTKAEIDSLVSAIKKAQLMLS